jgi:recombinational DNA repair ATPase RecF
LLLDEVVAELDERRRSLLLEYVQRGAQAILTATDPAMFTGDFLRDATVLEVQDGRILKGSTSAFSTVDAYDEEPEEG